MPHPQPSSSSRSHRRLSSRTGDSSAVEQWFRTTLYSIGDGVITTDHRGRVLQMNPVAEKLTAWKEQQARGKALSKVFRIVNELTRKKVKNPVQRVLREGIVIGLANHTLLIARNGREYPIADAGAPIKDDQGRIIGVVLVFRDQTAERNAQRAVQDARDLAESIIATVREPLLVLDENLEVVSANRSFYKTFHVTAEETIGEKVYDLGNRQWNIPQLRALLEDILPSNSHFDDYEVTHRFEHLGERTMLLNARRMIREQHRSPLILLAIEDITERRNAEQAIREREEWFRRLADTTFTAIFIYQGEKFVYVNRATEMLSGHSKEELLNTRFWDVVHPDDADLVRERGLARQRGEPVPNHYEFRIVQKGGAVRWIDFTAGKIDWQRKPAAIGTAFDITTRKEAEASLMESEERFRTLIAHAPEAIVLLDADTGRFISVNANACRLFEVDEKTLLTKGPVELSPPIQPDGRPSHESAEEKIQRALNGESLRFEWTHRTATGREIPCEVLLVRLPSATEDLLRGSILDISERKRAEKQIRESEALFRTLFDNLQVGVGIADQDGKILVFNDGMIKPGGYTRADIERGVNVAAFYYDPTDRQRLLDLLRTHGSVREHPIRFKRKDGTPYEALLWLTPIVYKGQPCIQAVVQDLTELKRSELEAQRAKEMYKQFFMEDLTGDYIATPDGTLVSCNPAFLRIFGFASMEEALSTNLATLFRSPEERQRLLSRLRAEKKLEYHDLTLIRRDGTPVHLVANLIGRFDEKGQLVHIQGYLFDDTRRRQLEEALRQTQKLESIGTLASGIAHDFNNILGIILGHASILGKIQSDQDKLQQSITAIINATQRGASLVKQLLTFARKSESVFEPLNINIIAKELGKMLHETFPRSITINQHLDPNLPPVVADATQMHQVLLNLCVNARDAMPKGGILTISTSHIDASQLPKRFQGTAARYVVLSVSDTGAGMEEHVRARIFEPFFTTKPPGHGTGLGLAVVHGVIGTHGGHIDVESRPGKGSTFRIYLPAAEIPKAEFEGAAKSVAELPGGSETILIVEDEETLRVALETILTTRGYTVITAEDGLQALELYRTRMAGIDLVISDIGLPRLTGDELFRRIRQINGKAKVILASGFIDPNMKSELLTSGVADMILKPYTISEVLVKARRILDTHQ